VLDGTPSMRLRRSEVALGRRRHRFAGAAVDRAGR